MIILHSIRIFLRSFLFQMSSYVVYRHVAPNGKVYVGITCQKPEYRWGKDGNGYRSNAHFMSAIQKYGWDNFKHEIILDEVDKENAELAEEILVSVWNLTDRRFGYNKKDGERLIVNFHKKL